MTMAEYRRYVARTEAWARPIEEQEDIVGSNGRVSAYPGDVHVVQHLRGETFSYVMTGDDFSVDWREPSDVDTEHATSETGTDELPGAKLPEDDAGEGLSTAEENSVDNPSSAVPTQGTPAENPTPAEPGEGETADDVTPDSSETVTDPAAPSPSLTASAPTGAGSNDGDVQGIAASGDRPLVGEGVSPVAGPTANAPQEAPMAAEGAQTVTVAETPPQPDTTTPSQTVAPVPGESLAEASGPSEEATSTTGDDGGDSGAAPTPNVDNTENVNTGNADGVAITGDSTENTVTADEAKSDASQEPEPTETGEPASPTEEQSTPAPTKTLPAKRANAPTSGK